MLFANVVSKRVVDGPRIVLRRASQTRLTPAGGFAKQAVLNHCVTRCGALTCGSQRKSGRAPEGDDPSNPSPAGSFDDVDGVNPIPVNRVVIPEICQPPSSFPTAPFCSR